MPRPLSVHLRKRVLARMHQGMSPTTIAPGAWTLPTHGASLCQRFRAHGEETIEPSCQPAEPATPSVAVQQALLLHKEHPTWGLRTYASGCSNCIPISPTCPTCGRCNVGSAVRRHPDTEINRAQLVKLTLKTD